MVSLVLSTLFLAAGMIHDRTTGRPVHPIYVYGSIAMLLSGPVRFAIAQTSAWHAIARFLIEL
jgi:hypothetical protein